MHFNLQILLAASISTLALTSWVPKPPKVDHSIRRMIDDPILDQSTPFNLTVGGRAVGYGTVDYWAGGFKTLVLQPEGVEGSSFTLSEGFLTTTDNMNVCRYAIEDRSLQPKHIFAAPVSAPLQQPVRFKLQNDGDVTKLNLLGENSNPILVKKSSPEGLDSFFYPLYPANGPDIIASNADGSSSSFLINQESRGSRTSYSTKECL